MFINHTVKSSRICKLSLTLSHIRWLTKAQTSFKGLGTILGYSHTPNKCIGIMKHGPNIILDKIWTLLYIHYIPSYKISSDFTDWSVKYHPVTWPAYYLIKNAYFVQIYSLALFFTRRCGHLSYLLRKRFPLAKTRFYTFLLTSAILGV